jgi:hypothetical protein
VAIYVLIFELTSLENKDFDPNMHLGLEQLVLKHFEKGSMHGQVGRLGARRVLNVSE